MPDKWQEEALAKLTDIFRDLFLDDGLVVTPATSPVNIEDWDSLAQVSLIAAVEKSFRVRFLADDLAAIDSVAALLTVLKERGANQP
jgi:acyl carrier protein